MTSPKIGIASYEEMKARTLAIARGQARVSADDPKVWFCSMASLATVAEDRERFELIVRSGD